MKSGNITNLDPKLRDRLEGIVALLCAEVETLMDQENDNDCSAALRAISDSVVILERYLYPEFDEWTNEAMDKLQQEINREII